MSSSLIKRILVGSALAFSASVAHSAEFQIVNFDVGTGVGFDDPTVVEPVGGNEATTLGGQRLAIFERAFESWGATLASDVPIVVGATFSPLDCDATGGVLGAAGPTFVFSDFENAPLEGTWFVSALAESLAGEDLNGGDIDAIAFFNGDIGVREDCLTGQDWYNGFDNNNDPATEIDLLTVVLHEIAHGLGFLELVSEDTGDFFLGLPDAYSANMFDASSGRLWTDLTNEERLESQVNTDNLLWAGTSVNQAAGEFLAPRRSVFAATTRERRSLEAQQASFGPAPEDFGPLGRLGVMNDGVEPVTDGCEPLADPNALRGLIVVVDRGGCAFTTKALNVQAAGGIAAIIANNAPRGRAPVGGFDANVAIPTLGISMADGDLLKLGISGPSGAFAAFGFDANFSTGVNPDFDLVRLFAPDPVQPGSSKSHFDVSITPNVLMEPAINDDLMSAESLDGTPLLLQDTGWVLLR